MKKKFTFLFFLFFSGFCFARKADFQIHFSPFFTDYNYSASGSVFIDSDFRGFDISAANFNFFGNKNHIGIFERASFQFADFYKAEFCAGPAFGFDINSFVRFQSSAYFCLGIEFERNQNLFEKYGDSAFPASDSNEFKLSGGIGSIFEFKLIKEKFISPVLGLDLLCNFLCRDYVFVKNEKSFYHLDFKNFVLLQLKPFVGVSFNF